MEKMLWRSSFPDANYLHRMQRVQNTTGAAGVTVERECIACDDPLVLQGGGERRIRRRAGDLASVPCLLSASEPVRLAQYHVERDHSSAQIGHPVHEPRHDIAPPGPLSDFGDAVVVDGNDADV